MALPTIKQTIYKLTLSNNETIEYRGFVGKEENILLEAKGDPQADMSEDEKKSFLKQQLTAIEQVLTNCTFGKVDVTKLPLVDIQSLFINIRRKSVGDIIPVTYRCKKEHDGEECGEEFKVKFDLTKLEVDNSEFDAKFMITDDVGIMLKQPTIKDVDPETPLSTDLSAYVDVIFDSDTVYDEFTQDELKQFIDDIPLDKRLELYDRVGKMPTIRCKADYKCTKCGNEGSVTAEGLDDFFG